jgi:hypothetical protein
MLPKLLERGVTLDLAFIDGWHTFDYTFLDFFYIDKLLRPGGVVLLHDRSWPSKQKVMQFIMTHRRYKELPGKGKRGQSLGAPASDSARGSPRFPEAGRVHRRGTRGLHAGVALQSSGLPGCWRD